MRNNHVKTMKKYIEEIMCNNQCIITHKDILKKTNANCSYSVLKSLKKYYDITFNIIKKDNCIFREYKIKRKENKQIWDVNHSLENVQKQLQLDYIVGKSN